MKRSKRFITLLCSIFAMSVTACGGSSNSTDKQIHDIYNLATKAGYEGTYEEWLVSIKGESGATILTGSGAPSNNLGKVDDIYLDISNWDVYKKSSSGWIKQGNIMGQQGIPGEQGPTGPAGKDELMSEFFDYNEYHMYEFIYESNAPIVGLVFYFRINGVIKQSINLKVNFDYKFMYEIDYSADDWVVEGSINKLNALIFQYTV